MKPLVFLTILGLAASPALADSTIDAAQKYAYGANIGWLTFEQTYGMPKFNPLTGEFSGSCYSANCGWITLANGAQPPLKTGTIDCGPDSDGDGIPDWWELERLAAASKPTNLATLSDTTDSDGDGTDDLAEFLADTDPFDVTDFLRITTWTLTPTVGTSADVTVGFPTTTSRLYDLEQVILTTPGTFAPVPGGSNLAGTGGELMVTDPGVDLSVIPDYYTRVIVKIPLKP